MLRRAWIVVASIISLLSISHCVSSAEINTNNYDIYTGDVNGDGYTDYYFSGKRQLILLHGDIVTPIYIPGPENFIIYGNNGNYSVTQPVAQLYTLDAGVLAQKLTQGLIRFAIEGADFYIWSEGTAGQNSTFLQGAMGQTASIFLNSFASQSLPLIIQTYPVTTAPSLIIAANVFNSSGSYKVAWTKVTGATRYELYENNYRVQNTADLSINFSGLTAKKSGTYYYQVRACNTVCGALSNLAAITVTVSGNSGSSTSSAASSSAASSVAGVVASPILPSLAGVPQPLASIDQARSLPANFDVTNSGQATYKVPIITALGTAGLVPEISLRYSSGGSNGIAGLGWSLSANGTISRCRQTEGVDKNAKPITWSVEDRFCLNGERLLLASGSYGYSGSTYKTEIDSFARITAIGGAVGNPDSFTVEYKNGIVETYGNTSDSVNSKNQLSNTNTNSILDWSLSKRSDSAGNKIIYTYLNDSDGQRLNTIDFAFGSGSTRNAYVQFNYEGRNDPISGFVAGYGYKTGKRVANIKSYNGSQEIRSYTLTYNQGTAYTTDDKLSRINKIQECVGYTCSPATEFEWQLPHYQLAATASSMAFLNGVSTSAIGDINGDGLQDIAWYEEAKLNTSSNSNPNIDRIIPRAVHYALGSITTDGKFQFQLAFFDTGSAIGPLMTGNSLRFEDINHDGRMDLIVSRDAQSGTDTYSTDYALLSIPQADGSWRLSATLKAWGGRGNGSQTLIDVNGDGLVDSISWGKIELPWDGELSGYGSVGLNNGNSEKSSKALDHVLADYSLKNSINIDNQGTADLSTKLNSAPIGDFTSITGDFNGDGRMDIVANAIAFYGNCGIQDIDNPSTSRRCEYGYGYNPAVYTLHQSPSGAYELRFLFKSTFAVGSNWSMPADFNNDGLSDFLIGYEASPSYPFNFELRINTGTQTNDPISLGVLSNQFNTSGQGNNESFMADVNSDGYQDFVWQEPPNATSTSGSSTIKTKYWDPSTNQFEAQGRVLKTQNYSILQNYTDVRFGYRIPRFKTDRFTMMDMNGDGIQDLVLIPNTQTSGSAISIWLGTNGTSLASTNKITAIKTGLEERKVIQYEYISNSENYSRITGFQTGTTTKQHCEMVVRNQGYSDEYTENECWSVPVATVDATKFYQAINDPWYDLLPEEQSLKPVSPVLETMGAMAVVTDVSTTTPSASKTNPQQIDTTTTAKLGYYYGQAKMQASGRGFLGFKTFTVVNRETGLRTETEYRQDWPYIGQARTIKTYTREGNKLGEQENIWGLVNCYDISGNANASCVSSMSTQVSNSGTGALGAVKTFLRKSTTKSYALKNNGGAQGDLISTSVELNLYDVKGNVLESSSNVSGLGDGISKSTINNYNYSGSTWSMQLGRLENLTVTASNLKFGAITRKSSFDYYQSGAEIGLLRTETIEPNNSVFTLTTTHTYDKGNKVTSSITSDGQTRQSEIAYDSLGRYVDKTYSFFTNGSNPDAPIKALTSEVIGRDKYGTPTELRAYSGTNYVTKITATTDFGTPYFTADSTGAAAEVKIGIGMDAYNLCPSDTKIWSISKSITGSTSLQCSDLLGRERRKGSIGFDGASWSLSDTEYDKLGRVLRTSAPYISNASERFWTTQTNDVLGRNISVSSPYKGSYVTTTTDRLNLTATITNPKSQARIETVDLLGHVVDVQDPLNGHTQFAYDARGNMREMRDPAGNTTTVGYDLRDRKISMSDPDKGNWIYKYNAFGDITCQQDGKGQTSVIRYDIAGRTFSRIDRLAGGNCDSPSGAVEKYTEWNWDTASNGRGQLASVKDSASVGGATEYQQAYIYDNLGRAQSTVTTIPGHLGAASSHYEKITYDQYGRLFQNFDAARTSATYDNNGVQNNYNAQGYLAQVVDAVSINNTQKSYYKINAMNARGNVTSAEYGNGVTQQATYYADTGLTSSLRADRMLGLYPLQDATLDWDELGNLNWREERGAANDAQRRNIREVFGYDSLNRLNTWTSSGDLVANEVANFNGIDNITDKTGIGNYQYGTTCGASTNAGPHALCRAGSTNYNYDKNGNMLNDSAGRVMAYTTYDMPSEITKAGHKTAFSYGPSRARYKRVDTEGSQTTTTLYLGSVEKVYYPDGTIQWKRNIAGVGLITQTVNSSGAKLSEAQRYLIKDHLGSLSLITDEIGAVEQSNYFDPWGKERKIVTAGSIKQWTTDTMSFVLNNKPITTRGFTGHEQLTEVGLIHMNGRIYDGALGRFVQADPIIQDPMRVQSLNRYSYVWNNPLNATDPSGFANQCIDPTEQTDPKGCDGKSDKPVEKPTEKRDTPKGRKVEELDKGGCLVNGCFYGVLPDGVVPSGTSKNSASNTTGAATSGNSSRGGEVNRASNNQSGGNSVSAQMTDVPVASKGVQASDVPIGYDGTSSGSSQNVITNSAPDSLLKKIYDGVKDMVWDRPMPGPDAWAVAGIKGTAVLFSRTEKVIEATDVAVKVNLNTNTAKANFGLYEIYVNGSLYKIGKAHLDRITQFTGLPTRLHQQLRQLEKLFGDGVQGKVVQKLGETTTQTAKAAERSRIDTVVEATGTVPPGNIKSY